MFYKFDDITDSLEFNTNSRALSSFILESTIYKIYNDIK